MRFCSRLRCWQLFVEELGFVAEGLDEVGRGMTDKQLVGADDSGSSIIISGLHQVQI